MLGVGRLRQSLVCHVFVTDMVGMGGGGGVGAGQEVNLTSVSWGNGVTPIRLNHTENSLEA